MPEQEFELYLSLLAKFLRLRPQQRGEIADELRDHLEARLHELAAAGVPRDEAVRRALDDLGDAAGLAADFTHIATHRRRRLIMRWTVRSIAALTACILLGFALWPQQNNVAPAPAVAQPGGGPAPMDEGAGPKPGAQPDADDDPQAATEAKLAMRLPKLLLKDVPLSEALEHLAEMTQTDIVIDKRYIVQSGLAVDTPVSLSVTQTKISVRTALELILEQVAAPAEGGGAQLGFTIRDGLIFITDPGQAYEVQVYNCRDLLDEAIGAIEGAAMPMMGMAGAMRSSRASAGSPMPGASGPSGMMPMGDMSSAMGGMGSMSPSATTSAGESLIRTIMETVAAESWTTVGGAGAISEFNGLLVVKQTQAVQRDIRQLLQKLREAGRGTAGTTAPPGAFGPDQPDPAGPVPPGDSKPQGPKASKRAGN